jgi:hypothetical protein
MTNKNGGRYKDCGVEVKSLPLKKKVNHYVPEFYLNEFSDPDDVSN